MSNFFAITFGQKPQSFINRDKTALEVINDFELDFPLSHSYILTGVRGSGKTVLLTNIASKFKEKENWIVVDVNPNREILEQIASGIYENENCKHLFLSASFSFSFHGLGFSIEGKEPVVNVKTLLIKMFTVVRKHNKKVLITIDEADNNINMRAFAHDFQSLLREDCPVYLIMTGLYENVNSLQNSNNLTFLYRAPKIEVGLLDKNKIAKEYSSIFKDASQEEINELANLTNGYAFAYQVAGYLYSKYGDISKISDEFDAYMSTYVYDKIWSALPNKEKAFILSFFKREMTREEIVSKGNILINEYSVYRDRLMKRGLVISERYGYLSLSLPRFAEFAHSTIEKE